MIDSTTEWIHGKNLNENNMSQLDLTLDQIRNGSNALALRTKNTPYIDPIKQPVIYSVLKKIADKQGKTVEQVQDDACKTDYEI